MQAFCDDPALGIRAYCEACTNFRTDCRCNGSTGPNGWTHAETDVRRWSFLKDDCDKMLELIDTQQVVLPYPLDEIIPGWFKWVNCAEG